MPAITVAIITHAQPEAHRAALGAHRHQGWLAVVGRSG